MKIAQLIIENTQDKLNKSFLSTLIEYNSVLLHIYY